MLKILFFTYLFTTIYSQDLSLTRNSFTSTSLPIQGLVFFAGGTAIQTNTPVNIVDIFNASSNSWLTSQLSVPRCTLASTSLPNHGLALFAGGSYNTYPNNYGYKNVDIFNANTNSWSVSYLSIGRCGLAGTSLPKQGLAFFAGGYIGIPNGSSVAIEIDVVDIYHANNNSWTTAKLSVARDTFTASSLPEQGIVFFAGGYGNRGQVFDTIDIYHYYNNSWTTAILSVPRAALTSASLANNGLVFFIGGVVTPDYNVAFAFDTIDIYNVSSNNWTISKLSTPRYYAAAASLSNSGLIFVGGGKTSITPITTGFPKNVEIYNVKTNSWEVNYLNDGYNSITYGTSLENYEFVFFSGINQELTKTTVSTFSNCSGGTYYFNNFGTFCQPCNLGLFAYTGSMQCLLCPVGNYCPFQSSAPILSAEGCYNNLPGSVTACENRCLAGTYCPKGSSSPTLCPQGFYCPENSMIPRNTLFPCWSGTYNQNIGSANLIDCLPCPAGTYCNKNISATSVIPCPAQYYCPEGSINFNTHCQAGYYCPFAATSQQPCPAGSFCPKSSSIPTNCPTGSYCPAGVAKPLECEAGYQCPSGSSMQVICQKNFYALPGSGVCILCQNGQFTLGEGSKGCETCPVSKFNLDGWFCMTEFEKIFFVFGWIVTVFSAGLSCWKLITFVKERLRKLRSEEIHFSLKNFVFLEKIIKKPEDEQPMIQEDNVKKLEEIVTRLQFELDSLKIIVKK